MAVFTDFFSEDVLDIVGGANIIKDSRQSLQLECDANIRKLLANHYGLKDLHRRILGVLVKVNGSEPPAIIVLTCLKETL